MNNRVSNFLAASILLLIPAFSNAQQTLKIDTEQSKINWTGKKPVGEHNGYVRLKEGELKLDNQGISGGSFVIDMTTITDLDIKEDANRDKLVNHLKSPDFFNVRKFPTARFVITRVSNMPEGQAEDKKATHRVEGDLTMKGITKKVVFEASINFLNGKFTASTLPFTINRNEWGVDYQSKPVEGNVRDEFIIDDIHLMVDLVSK